MEVQRCELSRARSDSVSVYCHITLRATRGMGNSSGLFASPVVVSARFSLPICAAKSSRSPAAGVVCWFECINSKPSSACLRGGSILVHGSRIIVYLHYCVLFVGRKAFVFVSGSKRTGLADAVDLIVKFTINTEVVMNFAWALHTSS